MSISSKGGRVNLVFTSSRGNVHSINFGGAGAGDGRPGRVQAEGERKREREKLEETWR